MIPVRYNGHRLSTLGIISPWTKWPYFLADGIFKWIFFNENDKIPIQISLKYVLRSTNDNKAALVQVMAWCWAGDKPLPETLMTQFTDAYMLH